MAQRLWQVSGNEPQGKQIAAGVEAEATDLPTGLYIVATPIGNLGDITLRALVTLRGVDVVACEDTRVTGGLLKLYGISQKLVSYHDHNAAGREPELLAALAEGKAVALVSDAGTPLISDPGFRLVQAARAAGHKVIAVPGASALLTALAGSGLPTDHFSFAGFLPTKSTARRSALADVAGLPMTQVFYETPPRLAACLKDMAAELGADRPAMIGRELTKLFEEMRGGTLGELAAHYEAKPTPKGEIVIVVAPPLLSAGEDAFADDAALDQALTQALQQHSLRDAVAAVSAATGQPKKRVYASALGLVER